MPTPPAVYYNEAVLLSGGTLDVPLNTSVPISCFSRHGNPTPTLSWIFNNEPIQQPDADKIEPEQNKKTYTRSIELRRPFTKDDDGKTLRCTLMHITLNTSLFIDTVLNISCEFCLDEITNCQRKLYLKCFALL